MIYIGPVLAAIAVFITVYALWVRPWLKAQPWALPFFTWVEPLEIALFKNSETILFARLKVVIGLVLAGFTYLGQIDLTPFLPFVPERWQPHAQGFLTALPMLISLVGMADERLRNTTTKPLEIVALPETKPLPPQVAIAVAEAEITKEVAVEVATRANEVG